jgi:putative DNA primase/helicase
VRQREVAASTVQTIWIGAQGASEDHPYLKRKGIRTHGARVTPDGRLVVPLYDVDGTLSTLQYIDHKGGKLYHPGGQTGGKFWMLGTMDEPGTLYVAEGFATAATIHQTVNRPVVVSYSASNLVPVTGTLREMYGEAQDIVIVADNDKSGVGQRYAEQASAKYGVRMVMPPIEGDANDYAQAGNNLSALLIQQTGSAVIDKLKVVSATNLAPTTRHQTS